MNRRIFLKIGGTSAAFSLRNMEAQRVNNLRAAVIGHTGRGDYGHGLESIFGSRPGIEVVALADPDPEGRSKTAARIGAHRQYADFRDLLEKEKPQLVSVAMRHADQHHEIILAALRAGAHVYSEKPFTRTPAEADELLAEAKRRGLRIAVAHTLRTNPGILRLRQALAEDRFGDLVELRAFGKQDTRAGGEDMMVLGTHLFDLMRMLAGDPLWCSARVLWKGRDITPADARLVKDNVGPVAGDEVFAHFAFPEGVNATFTSTQRLRDTAGNWGIEVCGSRGVARINCDVAPNVFARPNQAWKPEGKAEAWEPLSADPSISRAASDVNPVSDWLEAIATGHDPICSGQNGAAAVEMVMCVYQAALTRRRVVLPLANRSHPLGSVDAMKP